MEIKRVQKLRRTKETEYHDIIPDSDIVVFSDIAPSSCGLLNGHLYINQGQKMIDLANTLEKFKFFQPKILILQAGHWDLNIHPMLYQNWMADAIFTLKKSNPSLQIVLVTPLPIDPEPNVNKLVYQKAQKLYFCFDLNFVHDAPAIK